MPTTSITPPCPFFSFFFSFHNGDVTFILCFTDHYTGVHANTVRTASKEASESRRIYKSERETQALLVFGGAGRALPPTNPLSPSLGGPLSQLHATAPRHPGLDAPVCTALRARTNGEPRPGSRGLWRNWERAREAGEGQVGRRDSRKTRARRPHTHKRKIEEGVLNKHGRKGQDKRGGVRRTGCRPARRPPTRVTHTRGWAEPGGLNEKGNGAAPQHAG